MQWVLGSSFFLLFVLSLGLNLSSSLIPSIFILPLVCTYVCVRIRLVERSLLYYECSSRFASRRFFFFSACETLFRYKNRNSPASKKKRERVNLPWYLAPFSPPPISFSCGRENQLLIFSSASARHTHTSNCRLRRILGQSNQFDVFIIIFFFLSKS